MNHVLLALGCCMMIGCGSEFRLGGNRTPNEPTTQTTSSTDNVPDNNDTADTGTRRYPSGG